MQYGNAQDRLREHRKQVAERTQAIGDEATVHDLDIQQEQEILQLSDRWDKDHKDIEAEAEQKEESVVERLNGEIPVIEKDGKEIPAHAALMAVRRIFMCDNRELGRKASNMQGLTEADMKLAGYAIQHSVMNNFKGFNDLYDPGTGIGSYDVDSTQRPSERDARMRGREFVARLPLSMTAARVIPETKSTFKMTEYDHAASTNSSVNGNGVVWHNDENTPTPESTAVVKEWNRGMTPCKGALKFSKKNVSEGMYTMQALTKYVAEWAVFTEIIMTKTCTDDIRTRGTIPTENLDFNNLDSNDLLKIANYYTFSDLDYMIRTLAFSDQGTYENYANIGRTNQYNRSSDGSDLLTATGRDNFRMVADRDVFAHPNGDIAANTALGWDAMKTINVHMLGTDQQSAMAMTYNPMMYCYYWGVEFGTAFERDDGSPRVLFN